MGWFTCTRYQPFFMSGCFDIEYYCIQHWNTFQLTSVDGSAHAQILGQAGKEIATVGTGSAWPSKFNYNLIDHAKLLSYVMLASIDGFVGRINYAT